MFSTSWSDKILTEYDKSSQITSVGTNIETYSLSVNLNRLFSFTDVRIATSTCSAVLALDKTLNFTCLSVMIVL